MIRKHKMSSHSSRTVSLALGGIYMERRTLFDGTLHVYRRPGTKNWHCSTSIDGGEHRTSTKQPLLEDAIQFAKKWYFTLQGKHAIGALGKGRTFSEAAKVFEREYKLLTLGQRNEHYVRCLLDCLKNHTLPFFGPKLVSEVNAGLVQEYRIHRLENPRPHPTHLTPPKPPSRKTLREEMIPVRQVLKAAVRKGWLAAVPDLSEPFRSSPKITHRAWFSPEEYKQLYTTTRHRANEATNERERYYREQMHDFVLFMVNTGLRPDEAWNLQLRDVQVVRDEATREIILDIEVRGKRGVGRCKSMPGAVHPFRRLCLRKRPYEEDVGSDEQLPDVKTRAWRTPLPTDLAFPHRHKRLFNTILEEEDLKVDRDGSRRTTYSLRHTYICLRLLEGAKIYEVAKNCRTSVEMIEKHYARHLKNVIDTAAVNVRRSKKPKSATRRQGRGVRRRAAA
jgi:integrase